MKAGALNVRRSLLYFLFQSTTQARFPSEEGICFSSDDEMDKVQPSVLLNDDDEDISKLDSCLKESIQQAEVAGIPDLENHKVREHINESQRINQNNMQFEKIIRIVRSSNFIAMENLNTKYKGILKDILSNKIAKLHLIFKQECATILKQLIDVKTALHEKENKLRIAETLITEQEVQIQYLKNSCMNMNNNSKRMTSTTKKLEDENKDLRAENFIQSDELSRLRLDLDQQKQAFLTAKNINMILQREQEALKLESKSKVAELEKKLANQIQLRQQDRESVDKMTNQLQQHIQLSEQYFDEKLTQFVPNEQTFIPINTQSQLTTIQGLKQSQYLKEITKLKRELETLRKFKVEDSNLKNKVIIQAKEIAELQEKISSLQMECKDTIQQLEQQGRGYQKQPDILNDFLLYPPHLKMKNVDHYYKSPKKLGIPNFDVSKVLNTDYSGTQKLQAVKFRKSSNRNSDPSWSYPNKSDVNQQSFTEFNQRNSPVNIANHLHYKDFETDHEMNSSMRVKKVSIDVGKSTISKNLLGKGK